MSETRTKPSLRLLFGAVIFLSSFLLFLVEPIAARQLLPVFGGSAAVWVTCLVLFQTALLVAYLYAHWLALRSNFLVHMGLLVAAAASAVIWTRHTVVPGTAHPVLAIFVALSLSIGLPFLALGATSPLLQVWVARIETGRIPYRLYALSNLASLLALLAYPTVIEPYLTLRNQRLTWCCGFVIFALLSALVTQRTRSATLTRLNAATIDESRVPAATLLAKVLWVLLPMGAAMQLSAVTSYLTANIAAIPLLWILPLAVYLMTLIIAFQFPRFLPRAILTRLLVIMLAGLGYMLTQADVLLHIRAVIGFFLTELFLACLFCHTEACHHAVLSVVCHWRSTWIVSRRHCIAAPLFVQLRYGAHLSCYCGAGGGRHMVWGLAAKAAVDYRQRSAMCAGGNALRCEPERHTGRNSQLLWQPARARVDVVPRSDHAHTDQRNHSAWHADF